MLHAFRPDPAGVIEAVKDYCDECAQEQIEGARETWLADWLRQREDWLDRIGPLLPAAEVAHVVPSMKRVSAVHKARAEHRLIGFDIGGRIYFPAFQFRKDGAAFSWVREIATAIKDPHALLQFFAGKRPALNDRSMAEVLDEGAADEAFIASMVKNAKAIEAAEAR